MLTISYLTIEGEISGPVVGPSVYTAAPDSIATRDKT